MKRRLPFSLSEFHGFFFMVYSIYNFLALFGCLQEHFD